MNEHTKRRVLAWLIVASMAPLPFLVKLPTWNIPSSVWLYASAVTGYVGLVMLLWMYILGTKSVMGLYFADLAPVLSIHKWLGKYGTLAVFFHPIATAISYGDNLISYALVPNLSQSFERSVTWGRFALYALLVVWLTSALIRGRIAFRPWKYIHYLSYAALPLALVHVPSIGSSYRSLDFPRVYFMSIVALLVIFSVLRLRHLFSLGRVHYTVVKQAEISPGVYMILLQPHGREITVSRGQYLYLQTSLLGEEHPFSVLQHDVTTGNITVAYKLFGSWTEKLSQVGEGASVFVDGPYGEFTEEVNADPAAPRVFIAGGIGITPFVDHVLSEQNADQWLFHACKVPEEAPFSAQLRQRLGSRYVSIFSRVNTPAGPSDERGRISAEILARYLPDPAHYHYYLCGSDGFMQTTADSLTSLGVPSAHIHREAFSW